MIKTIVLEIIDFLSSFHSIKYNIQTYDKFILSCIFSLILRYSQMPYILLFSKYFLINWENSLYILACIDFKTQKQLFLENLSILKYLTKISILLISTLIFINETNFFKKIQKTNIMRKSFHIFLLMIYFNPNDFLIYLSEIILVLLIFLSCTNFCNRYFSILKSKRDIKKSFIVSHMFLLVGCTILYNHVNLTVFRLNLISICVLDSIASITGIFFEKNKKSFEGSLVGILSGIGIFYLYERKCRILYFICAGLVEYFDFYNDNIAIPVFSFLYYKCLIFEKYLNF